MHILKIFLVAIFDLVSFSFFIANTNVNAQTTAGYKVYTNDRLGISFEYPSTWTVEEKENRFEDVPDVMVYDANYTFSVTSHPNAADAVDTVGFEGAAKDFKDFLIGENRIIESMDFEKYRIDGKETGSFLFVYTDADGYETPTRSFIVNSEPVPITLAIQNVKDQFDSQKSQDIMNHIINSTKILT